MSVFNQFGVSPMSLPVGTGGVTKDRLVKLSTSGTAVEATAITEVLVGVAMETNATVGAPTPIQHFGKCRCVGSGAVTPGDRLMWATGGKVATLSGATAKIVGVALGLAAYADGDVVEFIGTFPSVNDTQ